MPSPGMVHISSVNSREKGLWSDKGLGREELDQQGLTPGKPSLEV